MCGFERSGERASERMHLIQEMQDHPEPLVVHAHIVFEVADQVGARQIHVGEGELVGGTSGNNPFLLYPDRKRLSVQPGAFRNSRSVNIAHISLRGS